MTAIIIVASCSFIAWLVSAWCPWLWDH